MSQLHESLFDYMGRNSARPAQFFNLPSEKVVEIGSRIRYELYNFFLPNSCCNGVTGYGILRIG